MSSTGTRVEHPADLAPFLQHTLIGIGTTTEQVVRHAEEAIEHRFNAVMVAGSRVDLAARVLRGTGIPVASALDFPTTGTMTSAGKAAEAESLVALGAAQIDIGVQVGWLRDGDHDGFRRDIEAVVRAAGVPVKVMLELALLTEDQRAAAVDLAVEAGVAYVKNASSGSVEQATVERIRYLRERAPARVGVKASGGIATFEHARQLVEAGADLVGSSACIAIVTGADGAEGY